MFGIVTTLAGLHVTGAWRDRSMQHTCSRHAAWDNRGPGPSRTCNESKAEEKGKRRPLGPYSRVMPRAIWWSYGGGLFLMSEVPLYLLCTAYAQPNSGPMVVLGRWALSCERGTPVKKKRRVDLARRLARVTLRRRNHLHQYL